MTVKEFRIAPTDGDFDRAFLFFRGGLGLGPGELWADNGQGQMYFSGRAVNVFFDHGYATSVDWIEVGGRVTEQVCFDFQIENFRSAVERAPIFHGARVHKIVKTPRGDQNARMLSPEGLQIALYQAQTPASPVFKATISIPFYQSGRLGQV